MTRALAIAALVLAVACVTFAVLWLDERSEAAATRALDRSHRQALAAELAQARARITTLTASVAEAEAVARHAEARAALVRTHTRERVRHVHVRAERILSEPPSQEGAQASLARARAFRERR